MSADCAAQRRAATPFALTGGAAIIAGGLLAAAVAHAPSQHLVWLSAYLVLIVGVAQTVFGVSQAMLLARPPTTLGIVVEWLAFNLGSAGVCVGTLAGSFATVGAGTVVFAASLVLFLIAARAGAPSRWLVAYRLLLALVFASSLVGLALSASANLH